MKSYTDNSKTISPNIELASDEYYNASDQLIYCSKCHTPRQCRHELFGHIIVPSIRCRCQQEIYDQEEAQRNLYEKQRDVRHLKANGLQDNKLLRDSTFDKDNGTNNSQMKLAYNYVANWEKMKAKGLGLILTGDVGTGKSFCAACIANALLDQGVSVLMTNFSRILNTLTGMQFENRSQFLDDINQYSLLIIDDLGVERNSEYTLEQIFNVIDRRYRSKKPLVVTTNLTITELKEPSDTAHSRIYNRILERCAPVCINEQNIRVDNALVNLKETQKLLL